MMTKQELIDHLTANGYSRSSNFSARLIAAASSFSTTISI